MTSIKIVQFSRPPHPCLSASYILLPPWLWTSNFKRTPSLFLQMTTNQLKESITQRWLFMLSGPSFRLPFVFSINSLILSGFSLTFFHLAESSLSAFSCFSKNIMKCLLFIIIHIFSTHFVISLFHLHNLKTYTNYGTTIPLCMWTNEIKTKTKSSHITFKLTTGSIAQFSPQTWNGIIKGWFHCLALVSKRRFLVNNVLMFGSAWCLGMVQIQFSLIHQKKIGHLEHFLIPPPPHVL